MAKAYHKITKGQGSALDPLRAGALRTILLRIPALAAALLTTAQGPLPPIIMALTPTPHAAECADFHRAGPGLWAPNGPTLIGNHGTTVTIGPGDPFRDDDIINGVMIGWLQTHECP